MNLLINAFNLLLYQPLFNALVLLYLYLPGHDFGVAVIILTILIRLLFYPLNLQGIRTQKVLQELQPKIKEIQERYKNDRAEQGRAMMELYQKEKINPFSGCLPFLIQLPILIALYQVFQRGLQPEQLTSLYRFVPQLRVIDPTFFGIVNLAQPSFVLAILAGITQFIQTKMVTPKTSKSKSKEKTSQFSGMIQKQLVYFFPIFTVFILLKLPSAIGLYWIVTTIFSIVQQYLVFAKRMPAVSG